MLPGPIRSCTPTTRPDGAVLLDVREPDEWRAGHAPDALHLPMREVPHRVAAELPRDREIVVVCRSGGRSAQVTAFLAAQGWSASNLDGGMHAWAGAGLPMVSENGQPAYVA